MEAVRSTPVLTRFSVLQVLLIDAALIVALLWRDLSDPVQMFVAHYILFVVSSDLAGLFLSRRYVHWFNVFRLTGSLSYLVLIVALAVQGMNGTSPELTQIQLGLIIVRIMHSGWLWRRFGPFGADFKALFARIQEVNRSGSGSERFALLYIVLGCVMLYFSNVAYWTHTNMGIWELDAVLVTFQGQGGLNIAFKMLVIELFVTDKRARFYMRTVVGGILIIQWPVMWSMFFYAPLPLLHGGVELFEIGLIYLAYRELRDERRVVS